VYLVQVGDSTIHETGPFDLFLKDLVPVEGLLDVDQIELIDGGGSTMTVRKIYATDENGVRTGEFHWEADGQVVEPRTMTDFLGNLLNVDVVEIGDLATDADRSAMAHYTIRVRRSPAEGEVNTTVVRFAQPEGERVRATVD